MIKKKFKNFWLVFVNIKAKDGFNFNDLIEIEDTFSNNNNFNGAWANVIIKAKTIENALEIVPIGLSELDFEVIFIDKIENIGSLIEYKEISDDVKLEVDWLSSSQYIFKISDKLFPYK